MITRKIAKLVLMLIISLNLSLLTNTAFADPEEETLEADNQAGHEYAKGAQTLDAAQKNPCVNINDENSKDYNYIVTIVEEPYDLKTNEDNSDLKYRICYRHSFVYVDYKGVSKTISALSQEKCLESAAEIVKSLNETEGGPIKKSSYFCREVQAILSKGGTAMIYGYIAMIYRWGAGLAGIIAVTIITISGVQISAAGGDPEAVGNAKKRILKSIAGLVVLFLSGLILYTINKNFFVS